MLSRDYVLGFVEGEGCFSIAIGKYIDRRERKTLKQNNVTTNPSFRVKLMFIVTNVASNISVLEEISKSIGGVGKVYIVNRSTKENQQNLAQLRVQSF